MLSQYEQEQKLGKTECSITGHKSVVIQLKLIKVILHFGICIWYIYIFHAIVLWFGTPCVHLCDFPWFSEICICVDVAAAVYEIGNAVFSQELSETVSSWMFNSPTS
jgi:hypothetical protein